MVSSINYYLESAPSGPVLLEVIRSDGRIIRRYSSADAVTSIPEPPNAPVPVFWFRPPQKLATTAGLHRFIWDVHYQPLPAPPGGGEGGGGRGGLPIQAIPYNSAPAPGTPWVTPGTYTVRLTAAGKVARTTDRGEAGSAGQDAGSGHAKTSTR